MRRGAEFLEEVVLTQDVDAIDQRLAVRLFVTGFAHGDIDGDAVTFLRGAGLGGLGPRALVLAEAGQRLLDLLIGDLDRAGLRANGLVIAEVDRRVDLHRHLEGERFGLINLDIGLTDRVDILLLKRLLIERIEQIAVGLLNQHLAAEHPLDHHARCLPRTEARQLHLIDDFAISAIERLLQIPARRC